MKKLTLLFAALVLSFTAQATIVNCNPGTNNLSWYLTQGDTLVLADGEYEEAYSITFNQPNACIKAAEGAKPVIKLTGEYTSFKLSATTTFEGITFDGGGVAKYPITTEGENTGIFTFNNCEFKNYQNYAISNKEADVKTNVNSVIVNNCLFHDGGSAIYMNEQAACVNITIQNTTIYNIAGADIYKAAIHLAETVNNPTFATQTLIDHLTIYNIQTSASEGAITIANASKTTISNCIIASPEQKHIDSYNVPGGATIQNCLVYNHHLDDVWTSIITNADPMFVDAANGDFMLYAESSAVGAGTDGSNLGDPRWGVKAGLQPGSGKLKAAVNAAQAGDTIVLGDGEYIESIIAYNVQDLVVMAAEGTKPVVKASPYMQHYATTTFIGITFDGQDVAEYTTYSYKTDTEKDLTFINCVFKNYTKSCVTIGDGGANVRNLLVDGCSFDGGSKTPAAIKSSGIISACDIKDSEIKGYTEYGFVANSSSAHTDELSVDNTIIHDCGYSAIYVTAAADGKDKQSCSSFELTNSTIYNIGNNTKDHGAVDIRDNANITSAQQVLIDHVTLYNFNTKDWYGGFMIYQSANATISNCIVSNPADLSGKNGYHVYGNAVVTNSLYNNCNITSGAQQTANIKADPFFVDAANANFMLSANSPAVGAGTNGSNLGDTRWGVSASLKGKVINITPGQAKLNNAVGSASICDTIVLADGTYEEPWTFSLDKEGLVIMAAENAKPEIVISGEYANLEISATTTFDGITFNGNDVAKYIISIQDSTSMNTNLVLINCEFKNWTQWAVSNQYSNNVSVDSVIIDNCLFHDGGGSAIYFSQNAPEGTHACNYIKMTNSSIYNVVSTQYAGIIHVSSNGEATGMQNKVIIDHVTMYNLDGADLGIIAVRKSSDLTISNTIIANPAAGERASYVYGGVAEKVIYYNVSQDGDLTYTNCLTDDPLFVDAANNDFMLQANSPAIGKATDGSNLGDPRWGVAEPELITLTTGDNDAVIEANIGKTVNVKIERSFTANDGYYTLCVPFNMPASVIGTVYEIDGIEEYVAGQDGGLSINLKQVTNLLAGVPYLVEPKENMNELVVEGVIIANDKPSEDYSWNKGMVKLSFQGCYSADGKTDGATEYYIGNGGYLYNNVVDKRGLCGFFTITDNDDNPVNIRARVVTREEVETGLDNNQLPNINIQKVLENGQLIIIRDSVKYNVQGQKL